MTMKAHNHLRIDSEVHLHKFTKFIDDLPHTYVKFLSRLAGKGRELLRKDLLSGQTIDLHGKEKDKIGRFVVKGKVAPQFAIVFTSYPVNLFERGRLLRSGVKEAGKYIITREFKSLLGARLQPLAESALEETVGKEAAKV